jgi:hypothetical protein
MPLDDSSPFPPDAHLQKKVELTRPPIFAQVERICNESTAFWALFEMWNLTTTVPEKEILATIAVLPVRIKEWMGRQLHESLEEERKLESSRDYLCSICLFKGEVAELGRFPKAWGDAVLRALLQAGDWSV